MTRVISYSLPVYFYAAEVWTHLIPVLPVVPHTYITCEVNKIIFDVYNHDV